MDMFFSLLTPSEWAFAFGIGLVAGFIKGVVGFAMPLVLISGLTMFLPPELALAGLIFPTVITNMFQALRQGVAAAWDSIKIFKVFLIAGGIALGLSAQTVRFLAADTMLLVIGVPITLFALWQVTGRSFTLSHRSTKLEAFIGAFAGAVGGVSAVWGPPTVAYLTALGTPKNDQMRVQGVIYGLGAVLLLFSHFGSGVLRAETVPFSAVMILPSLTGMWLGSKVMDKIDQASFKKATLVILLIAGANLVRRGVFG
ncbi:sulfite exporter TauE/SafE family protein [Sulfitobacter sp. UBA1132]|uniref:sulfite exporter TauE/SafE family protein n=1 Tax=Sulfitobacter sp. UBA1132 TaxID=1947582 RepID=UPI00257C33BD|nr:sulfite exporter TauE/SafE family protein [Sulfitobacter sp. UBA1132]